MSYFNVIFPMAGESSRFNYNFKPFLQISDTTFIELAYLHFKKYESRIHKVYFVITESQEKQFNVNHKLKNLFHTFELIILNQKTSGPYLTIQSAIKSSHIDKNIPCFICDCDHSINIEPMIHFIDNHNEYTIIIPVWDITNENSSDWGIVYLNEKNEVIDFSEKKIIHKDYIHKGIIGCYYFKNLNYFTQHHCNNISEHLSQSQENIQTVQIKEAEFFGDMDRLEKTIQNRKKYSTIFCDIDGTIVFHEKEPDNLSLNIIDGSIETLHRWKNEGNTIILTTSRSKESDLKDLLTKNDIPYDKIITNLPSGKRILINDIKYDIHSTAYSFNIPRNHGINKIEFEEDDIEIIKVFKGNSFSKTILVNNQQNTFVRKYILKKKETTRHYQKLKRQYYDLQRMNRYSHHICPMVIKEVEKDYIYYYDFEYLNNYQQLTKNNKNELFRLLNILNDDVYCTKKINHVDGWIEQYFKNKIKIDDYKSLDPIINQLFNLDKIIINKKEYIGLNQIFNKINIQLFNPNYLSVIHGDLTFENILYQPELNDIKLIDLDGSDFLDAIELDLGKLLQSYLSNYEYWIKNPNILIEEINLENNLLTTIESNSSIDDEFYQLWCSILNENDIHKIKNKGIFFMCTHLLRAIPYLFQNDIRLCIYCIKEIIVWLNSII